MCKACALDRQPCTASDSAMLWVDLSKSFMTFSRAVGQLLEKSRGVHAEVRKAVWSLYSRPHRSFDWAFGWGAALAAYVAPCRRSNPQPLLPFARHGRTPRATYFIFQCKAHPNDTTSPWYSRAGGLPSSRHVVNTSRSEVRSHVKAAMLHAAGSDSARASTSTTSYTHVWLVSYRSHKHRPPAQADTLNRIANLLCGSHPRHSITASPTHTHMH